jgi:hypothetical protein
MMRIELERALVVGVIEVIDSSRVPSKRADNLMIPDKTRELKSRSIISNASFADEQITS